MVRIFIDKLGSGHEDLFIKIDNSPTYIKTVDSYYLLDFLEITDDYLQQNNIQNEEVLSYATKQLIHYWNSRIGMTDNIKTIFLPFDFQDESIGGLMVTLTSLGIRTKIVYSELIRGYEVNKTVFDQIISERKIEFKNLENVEWLISYQQFYDGLKWSLNELNK